MKILNAILTKLFQKTSDNIIDDITDNIRQHPLKWKKEKSLHTNWFTFIKRTNPRYSYIYSIRLFITDELVELEAPEPMRKLSVEDSNKIRSAIKDWEILVLSAQRRAELQKYPKQDKEIRSLLRK